jgi:hypothetical protein
MTPSRLEARMVSSDREALPENEWTPFQRERMKGSQILKSRDRSERRIAHWIERQNQMHDWVCLADMAEWYARKPGDLEQDERRRARAYSELQESVLHGEFFLEGRRRIRYLPLCVGIGAVRAEPSHKRITASKQPTIFGRSSWPYLSSPLPAPKLWLDAGQLRSWVAPGGTSLRTVLMFCWVPRGLCLNWFDAREINSPPWLAVAKPKMHPADSPRSNPRPKDRDERDAVAFLANLLRDNPDLGFENACRMSRERYKSLSKRGFRERVWGKGRKAAGLSEIGFPGRKRKSLR